MFSPLAKEMGNAEIQEVMGPPEASGLLAQAYQKPTTSAVFSLATGLAQCGQSIGTGGTEITSGTVGRGGKLPVLLDLTKKINQTMVSQSLLISSIICVKMTSVFPVVHH
jgi:hypothetical protein